MMQCLTEIIGVTNSDCECIISGLTSEQVTALRQSKSGLFMDDLPGGIQLKALRNVDACRSLYTMAIDARNNAIKTLESDLVVAMANKYKKDRNNFIGTIGRMSYAQSLGISRPLQGVKIRPIDYSDGVITMSRLQIILNQAVTVTVRLIRAVCDTVIGEELAAWEVITNANAYTLVPLTQAVKMPLVVDGQTVEYYLLYDISEPGGPVQPKDTGLVCGTCNRGVAPYSQFVDVVGVQLNNTTNLKDRQTDQYSHGLIMDVEIKCDNETLICREYKADDALAVVMAYATWYKSGELLIEDVLKQTDISRYTTMAREYNWGKRNHFRAEYESRVSYLAQAIDTTAGNCYVCRNTTNQPFFAGILS